MPTLVGFGTFAALPEEHISEKISRRILSGDQGMIVWCFTRETGGLSIRVVGVTESEPAALRRVQVVHCTPWLRLQRSPVLNSARSRRRIGHPQACASRTEMR
jgi:hypothetical protein